MQYSPKAPRNIRCFLWSSVVSFGNNLGNVDEIEVYRQSINSPPVAGRERNGTKSPGVERRVPEFLPKHSPSVRSLEAQDEPHDAADDFSRSLDACYAAICERVRAGGKGWGSR